MSSRPRLLDAAFGAAAAVQRIFDHVVALGLDDRRLTRHTLVAAVATLSQPARGPRC